MTPSFQLGEVVATPAAMRGLAQSRIDATTLLGRHLAQDWSDMPPEDRETNARAVTGGGRIFSSYDYPNELTFWVITEWDRSVTTILFPNEY